MLLILAEARLDLTMMEKEIGAPAHPVGLFQSRKVGYQLGGTVGTQ